jgi:eukaryotic-like serine/threonine-protein kinase
LKLLPAEKAGAEDIARFEREVQLTSELTHPNTIAIYDYGRSMDGVFYYVMEFLDGIDLESLVERVGALPAPRVVKILRQICGSLEEAHAKQVIHRDIKPANVILCRRGQVPDFVKVVDFGLVKELAHARDETVTAVGMITGTPAYLAPEAMTDPDHVGPAADLYAVGALGYFLVTGKMVFDGMSTVLEMCSAHLHKQPVAPSKRIDQPIPVELERLIMACLAKEPKARPESARAMSDALEKIDTSGFTTEDALAWWSEFEKVKVLEPSTGGGEFATTLVDPSGAIGVGDTIAVMPRPT